MDTSTTAHRTTQVYGSGLLAVLGLALSTGAVHAGDFVHHCRSADGAYEINDEQLRSFDNKKGYATGPAIPYRVVGKYQLRKRAGYCVSYDAPGGSARFPYQSSTYALHVKFRRSGNRIENHFICDMASDGLPAAYRCHRDVRSKDWTAPTSKTIINRPTRWFHGQSQIRIVAKGKIRRLIYVRPSEALVDRGVQKGDLLFEGYREGKRYIGQAYTYSRRCGSNSFSVRGRVEDGERAVVMRGRKPIMSRKCKLAYRQEHSLEITRR